VAPSKEIILWRVDMAKNGDGHLLFWKEEIGPSEARTIAGAIKVNQAITQIYINNCNIGKAEAIILAEGFKVSKITWIDLVHNNIGDNGAIAIANAVKFNKNITNINLFDNEISDIGAGALAEALKVNINITEIVLDYRGISDTIKKEIDKLQKDNKQKAEELAEKIISKSNISKVIQDESGKTKLEVNLTIAELKELTGREKAVEQEIERCLERTYRTHSKYYDCHYSLKLIEAAEKNSQDNGILRKYGVAKKIEVESLSINDIREEVTNYLKPTDLVNEYGNTSLLDATNKGEFTKAYHLLEKGANPNQQNKFGYTALMYACRNNDLNLVKALLIKGADIKLKNNKGKTALDYGNSRVKAVLKEYMSIESGANKKLEGKLCGFIEDLEYKKDLTSSIKTRKLDKIILDHAVKKKAELFQTKAKEIANTPVESFYELLFKRKRIQNRKEAAKSIAEELEKDYPSFKKILSYKISKKLDKKWNGKDEGRWWR
jgi:ankyrin repeat protein